MWQRIQTLYLGIATALIAAMFFSRFATIAGPDGTEEIIRYYEKMPFLVLLIMLLTSHIAAVSTYKAFFLQARVCVIAGLLSIGFQAWLITGRSPSPHFSLWLRHSLISYQPGNRWWTK